MLRLRTLGGLWIENAGAGAEGGPRPRRLALLAILAAAGPKGVARERLLSILWPDSETDRGRHSLSQTIYSLRRDLGDDVVIATTSVLRLDDTKIESDLADYRAAVAAEDFDRAASLYQGPFLNGFRLGEAPDFDRWADEERNHLAVAAAKVIEAAAERATSRGDLPRAAAIWHQLALLDPLSGRVAAAHMRSLMATGEEAAALAYAKQHADLVRRELGAEPDPAIKRLEAELRRNRPGDANAVVIEERVVEPAPSGPPPVVPEIVGGRRWRPGLIAAVVVVVAVGAWVALSRSRTVRPSGPLVLAVGDLRDLTTPDSAPMSGVLSEMLTTSVARLTTIQVVAHSRILELLTPADTSARAQTGAARRAGAAEILEGEVTSLGGDSLTLALRRVDLASGVVRRGYRVAGVDRFALIDSVTAALAVDLRVSAPTGGLADLSTGSPMAYRLYEAGLKAYFQYDPYSAHRLFRSAIEGDSTFAMATYYAWRTAAAVGDPATDSLGLVALRLASRAPTRDRLVIRAHVGATQSDIGALAAAESLATGYPNDPEALVRAASVFNTAGADLARSVAMLNRAVAIDSVTGEGQLCRTCEALQYLVGHYQWADSTELAWQTAERWIRLRPTSHAPWTAVADLAVSVGRIADAARANRIADSLGRPAGSPTLDDLAWQLRRDRADSVESRCRRELPTLPRATASERRWWCVIALRMEGRYRDAFGLARQGIIPGAARVRSELGVEPIQSAWVDFEIGRALTASIQFLRFANDSALRSLPHGLEARQRTWNLTLAATAMVAAGDTSEARLLVDSIAAIGKQSLFGRDPRLHHFVRGLILAKDRDHRSAVAAFRAALVSPSFGYSRISYELAKSLLALGRPAEAIPVLQGPLHGGVDGSGLYLTRTELHELLATAFDAAGQPDSAAAHYAVVARAWRNGDPPIRTRADAARQALTRLGRPVR